ncbi:PqqD family peptide modification chaperone [Flexivirga caeni]|uniref:PqqD family peptide modification chaperone n=1 Tax=Flexivirga caeni TaxID=2294115 RepID=A0A3M9M6X0_9MICO|nr:PqqD family peptide modification chaperone [Flexivirga caeni]RNI20925.1 PqqD family peptide modification chaperone [Flexivirga caeni]
MLNTTPMPMRSAVNLAHALCQSVADAAGIQVLFLKGPTAGAQGLRSADYVSGDVDVLCTREDLPAMEAGLRARGWHPRPVSTGAREFTTHSVTYLHDSWPCDIDIHTTFPGFFADPATVFDSLWQHREEHEFSGIMANTPDRVAQFLVLLLHGLRAPSLARNQREINDAHTLYVDNLAPHERRALRALVESTDCPEPTAEFFAGVGEPVDLPPTPSEGYIMWRLLTSPSRTENWMLWISRTHGLGVIRVLFRAVVPTRADILTDHPESARNTRALLTAYWRRLVRAARLTPHAVRSVLRAKRELRHTVSPRTRTTSSAPIPAAHPIPNATFEPHAVAPAQHLPQSSVAETPRNAIEWAESEQTLFVLPLAAPAQSPLALRDSAAALWFLMEECGSAATDLAAAASAHWDLDTETVRPEVDRFLTELTQLGALPDPTGAHTESRPAGHDRPV